MSKRTVYALHPDKGALFRAAVERATDRYTIPREAVLAVVTDDLAASLAAVARQRIRNLATVGAVRLQRVLLTESYRFPDLYAEVVARSLGPTLEVLDLLFERHRDELAVTSRQAATAFLSLAVGGPARPVVVGAEPVPPAETEERVRFAVRLFLDGVRRRV
jgi:TetR/AcrR family transcriptional regulator, mexJK operon transcriptional repressor